MGKCPHIKVAGNIVRAFEARYCLLTVDGSRANTDEYKWGGGF